MEYVFLGSTGIKVSRLCLGTMQFGWTADEDMSFRVMDYALEHGINFIDTANIYSRWAENSYAGKSEEIIGKWMHDRGNRDDIILATKVRGPMGDGPNDEGVSRRHVFEQVRASMKRLQTEYIDLYQTHWDDQISPLDETMRALNSIVEKGWVHYLGASNIQGWRLMKALWISDKHGWATYQVIQPKYSLVERKKFEFALQKIARSEHLGVIPYSPLAGGFLTGKYREEESLPDSPRAKRIQELYFNERGWSILREVRSIAEEVDATPAQVSLAWLLAQDTITAPIIGANTIEQLEEILAATELKLNKDHVERLTEVSKYDV